MAGGSAQAAHRHYGDRHDHDGSASCGVACQSEQWATISSGCDCPRRRRHPARVPANHPQDPDQLATT